MSPHLNLDDPDKAFGEGRSSVLKLAGVEIQQECQLYGDDSHKMTNSRMLARFLSRFNWYYPSRAGGPSLDAAWAHYEHVTLARYYSDEQEEFVRAPPGERERPTELYPIWKTPVKELMDFGISVRMYFSTLLVLSGFMVVAGVLNLPLFHYFWNYAENNKEGVDNVIRGSAVCDETEWVQCESCNAADYAGDYPEYRLDGQNVRRNSCDFENWLAPGMSSYVASILLLVLFGIAFFWLQRKAEIVFDEEMQTASDYSIKIANPPPDATDPEEWRRFLGRYAVKGVTHISIALDNAKLVEELIKRRKMLKNLAKGLPYGTDMSDDSAVAAAVAEATTHSWISFLPGVDKKYAKIKESDEKIKNLMQHDYKVVTVFATFETERGQRNALHSLSTGKLNVWKNKLDTSKFQGNTLTVHESAQSSTLDDLTKALYEDETEARTIRLQGSTDSSSKLENLLLFRGQKVLNVKEAGEPNDVRWTDLQTSSGIRLAQYIGTTLGMVAFIAWSGFFVYSLEENYPGTYYTTFFITITNVVVPKICEFINNFESHSTEGGRQTSLYVKIALFRWFNSAIALSIVSTFIETISVEDGNEEEKLSLNYKVYPIIFAEMFTIPLIKLLDIMGNVRKHLLAPRARDQEEMNSHFIGAKFELAERYTDATKVLFVSLFFSAILPEAFFLGAAALLIQFAVGKFCLMRLWRPTPDIGPHLASLSRNYFFSSALVAHFVMSAYWWSGYPYDSVCENENGEYVHCNQDFFGSFVFPPLPRFQPEGQEWMSESQETLTSWYAWTSLAVVVVAVAAFLNYAIYPMAEALFRSTYEPDGKDQGIDFSAVKHLHEVQGYIPQCKVPGFAHPLIFCDLRGVDEDLVGWTDQFHGLGYHNLVHDAHRIIGGESLKPVFSIVKHWPPVGPN